MGTTESCRQRSQGKYHIGGPSTIVLTAQMNTQSLLRARMASQTIARRGFSTTRPRFDSPFHYPEGPRSGLPFNPKTRFFWLRYWTFMGVGFSIPFGMAVWHTYKA